MPSEQTREQHIRTNQRDHDAIRAKGGIVRVLVQSSLPLRFPYTGVPDHHTPSQHPQGCSWRGSAQTNSVCVDTWTWATLQAAVARRAPHLHKTIDLDSIVGAGDVRKPQRRTLFCARIPKRHVSGTQPKRTRRGGACYRKGDRRRATRTENRHKE
jgi:hypothetical protein